MSLKIPEMSEDVIAERTDNFIQIDDELSGYLKQNSNGGRSENFLILRKLHKILQNSQNLTDSQKLDYCTIERYYMKLYLRNCILKKE